MIFSSGHLLGARPTRPVTGVAKSRRQRGVMAAAVLATFIWNLDFFAINLALPTIAADLGARTTDIQWAMSGYMVALGATLIAGGRLGDLLGRRRMMIVGVAVFGIGSGLSGAAESTAVLIAFRIVQGIGAGIAIPAAVAVIADEFRGEGQSKAIGVLWGLAAIGSVAGPIVGGFLAGELSWRWIQFVNVPIAAAAIVLAFLYVRESKDESAPRVDLRGLATVTIGAALLLFAIDRGDTWGWDSAAFLGAIAVSILLIVAFVLIERRVRYPLIDLNLFSNRPYVAVVMLGVVTNIAIALTAFAGALYVQEVRDLSALAAGAIFMATSATAVFISPVAGALAERHDARRLMAVGLLILAIGVAGIAVGPAIWLYTVALAVIGVGYGAGWALASAGAQRVVRPERAGEAAGVLYAMTIGIAGMAVAIGATLIEQIAKGGTGLGSAIETVFVVIAIGTAVAAALVLLLTRGISGPMGRPDSQAPPGRGS